MVGRLVLHLINTYYSNFFVEFWQGLIWIKPSISQRKTNVDTSIELVVVPACRDQGRILFNLWSLRPLGFLGRLVLFLINTYHSNFFVDFWQGLIVIKKHLNLSSREDPLQTKVWASNKQVIGIILTNINWFSINRLTIVVTIFSSVILLVNCEHCSSCQLQRESPTEFSVGIFQRAPKLLTFQLHC
jgi:hypothetical protein